MLRFRVMIEPDIPATATYIDPVRSPSLDCGGGAREAIVDVKLRSWARAEDMVLLMESSARETWAWTKSLAVRICGVSRDVRFLVVDADDVVVVVVLLLLLDKEDEGGKFEMGRSCGGFDWRWGLGKSS